jgi:CHAT domain-containing protein
VEESRLFFGPIPGATDEVRAIRSLMPEATMLIGAQATESAVRRLSGPRILHVATHGFFFDGSNEPRFGSPAGWANPLVRSGLALAGANQGRRDADDGVLTALEVAGLDLWGTKLVVLSACDTARGVITHGEGVYGLRRALILAGSESQLMSLWAVSDRSTRDLMIGYYTRLTKGEGRSEALRQTQLAVIRDGRHQHPYYWASFIVSGQWASLDGHR